MKTQPIHTILLIAISIAFTACGKVATTTSSQSLSENSAALAVTNSVSVPAGNYSSGGNELSVTNSGASLDLGCGSGNLSTALVLDENHAFKVYGTYSSGVLGSIVNADGTVTSTQNQFAIYSGNYDSSSQTLTVNISIPNSGDTVMSYTLTAGDPTSPIYHCL